MRSPQAFIPDSVVFYLRRDVAVVRCKPYLVPCYVQSVPSPVSRIGPADLSRAEGHVDVETALGDDGAKVFGHAPDCMRLAGRIWLCNGIDKSIWSGTGGGSKSTVFYQM